MKNNIHWLVIAISICAAMMAPNMAASQTSSQANSAQKADNTFTFDNSNPAWGPKAGPRVTIDRFVSPYVQRGSMEPFANLIESDGFQVSWLDEKLDQAILDQTAILVIANAYTKGGANDYRNFSTLEAPSVYSAETIAKIKNWVENGGSLLVLADHSPFAGGAIKLMEAFEITPMTGFAIHRASGGGDILTNIDFRRQGSGRQVGRLSDHPITNGAMGRKPIDHFYAFGGQAILPSAQMSNLLTIPQGFETLLTYALRRDFNSALRIDSSGLSQGAVGEIGKGRIAVFGETGAFTSQSINGGKPFGLAAPQADQNGEFVLSTFRWLARYQP